MKLFPILRNIIITVAGCFWPHSFALAEIKETVDRDSPRNHQESREHTSQQTPTIARFIVIHLDSALNLTWNRSSKTDSLIYSG